jgi:peptide/nickel transport system ATP-binding protein
MALLEVENLQTTFASPAGELAIVRGLSFQVERGETVAIVGESGSGKSVTALSIMRLLDTPPASLSGRVLLEGRDLLALSESEMRKLRGSAIGMVFQEPMSSLNPVLTIGAQVVEAVLLHHSIGRTPAQARAVELLTQVGIPAPEQRLSEYPRLLIADEPTTALDVTIQAHILALLRRLQARNGSAVILITHDLGVVAELADRVVVIYAGRKVEEGDVGKIFSNPRHPYTRALIAAMPRLSDNVAGLTEIPGTAPRAGTVVHGCPFAPRCPAVTAICREAEPDLTACDVTHAVACHHVVSAAA